MKNTQILGIAGLILLGIIGLAIVVDWATYSKNYRLRDLLLKIINIIFLALASILALGIFVILILITFGIIQ